MQKWIFFQAAPNGLQPGTKRGCPGTASRAPEQLWGEQVNLFSPPRCISARGFGELRVPEARLHLA